MDDSISVYVHIPFCRRRCSYCDFNTYAGMDGFIPEYMDALCQEIRQAADGFGQKLAVRSIYIGGGTPSTVPVPYIENMLNALRTTFIWDADIEISLEANPGTVTLESLRGYHGLGINRLSFGVQSCVPEELAVLGRIHDPYEVIQSIQWARQAGFDNLSLDLMFGLPGQTMAQWLRSVEFALRLGSEHLSVYALTLEKNTPLSRWIERGLLPEIDEDMAADMYEQTQSLLGQAGYEQYEISNWAKAAEMGRDFRCRHNLTYWRDLPYFGVGAGAHGYVSGVRTENVASIQDYLARSRQTVNYAYPRTFATGTSTVIGLGDEIKETMMMGLRLVKEGISRDAFLSRFGLDVESIYDKEIRECIHYGLLEWRGPDERILRLTPRGILLGNQVFYRFVGKDLAYLEG